MSKLEPIIFNNSSLVLNKEWIITNGLGGYASSSLPGINTRKYHGLLVAALRPPGDRTVCLSRLDEEITLDGQVFNINAGSLQTDLQASQYIKQLKIEPNPTYTYQAGNISFTKTLFMPQKQNSIAAIYSIENSEDSEATFRVSPLMTCRYFDTVVNRKVKPLEFSLKDASNGFEVTFKKPLTTVSCKAIDGCFNQKISWLDGVFYYEEQRREEANNDDLFYPGYFEISVPAKTKKRFAITALAAIESNSHVTDPNNERVLNEVDNSLKNQAKHIADLIDNFYKIYPTIPASSWLNWIITAADSFLVENFSGKESVMAGYFWFEPWGRDTFISLPGLLLIQRQFGKAKNALENFMHYCKDGLIPNFISDRTGKPVFNTVDASLWYINAVYQYLKYTGDFEFVKNGLWDNLKLIIESYQKGTMHDIHLDDDGLVAHGSRLTWMDAIVEGDEITPRTGKAVEIQALWFNSLKIMEQLANKFAEEDTAKKYAAMAQKTLQTFNSKYWNKEKECLYDVLEANQIDKSIRPNQIFAVSLDYTMLSPEKCKKVVDLVNGELVTPFGLRTLAVDDPKYVGRCFGNRRSRDTAYHNGTIWPWLLGPYVTAYVKVNNENKEARLYAKEHFIEPLFKECIYQGGIGTIAEIFDCESPNHPRGCISQAWSIAEPLRAYVEDIFEIKPQRHL